MKKYFPKLKNYNLELEKDFFDFFGRINYLLFIKLINIIDQHMPNEIIARFVQQGENDKYIIIFWEELLREEGDSSYKKVSYFVKYNNKDDLKVDKIEEGIKIIKPLYHVNKSIVSLNFEVLKKIKESLKDYDYICIFPKYLKIEILAKKGAVKRKLNCQIDERGEVYFL